MCEVHTNCLILSGIKGDSYDHVRKEPPDDTAYPPITYHYISPQRMLIMANKTREIPRTIHQLWFDRFKPIPQSSHQTPPLSLLSLF
jgi:hypothetical protein